MTEILGIKIPLNPWVLFPLIVIAATALAYLADVTTLWIIKRTINKATTTSMTGFTSSQGLLNTRA